MNFLVSVNVDLNSKLERRSQIESLDGTLSVSPSLLTSISFVGAANCLVKTLEDTVTTMGERIGYEDDESISQLED